MWLLMMATYISKTCGLRRQQSVSTAFTYRRVVREYGQNTDDTKPSLTNDGKITVNDVVRCLTEPYTYVTHVLRFLIKPRPDFQLVVNELECWVQEKVEVFPLPLLGGVEKCVE